MPTSLERQLIRRDPSRALVDFEEKNRHFEAIDDRAYMELQSGSTHRPSPASQRAGTKPCADIDRP